ncbi:hypothetical protein T459_24806 [Capsicum annuum]|uniref:Seipin-1-like n=1 Tax=Capsicum annuum TaxID=4072 RepID=A0A2G2YJD7_CAPAN|nr:hypothetical protein T459_24805 [Capsicum annuum]PHT69702.1 hypothetical protein T459_24806 [Capsicum annuum]
MEEKDELEEKEYVDDNEDELKNNNLAMQNTSSWFSKMISLQAEVMTTILISLVSPIFYILSFANSEYYNLLPPEQETEKKVTVAVNAVATVPSKLVDGGTLLLKKFGVGILGAAYVCMILTTLLIVSGILGFGLVRMWMEEPVVLREELYFDYADVHPKAVFSFGGRMEGYNRNDHRSIGVPVGHTMYVSLFLLMPESGFNRDIGVFQAAPILYSRYIRCFAVLVSVSIWLIIGKWKEEKKVNITLGIHNLFYQLVAESLSKEGLVMARSSHPCMLRFRSLPIRLMREFMMSVPLVLGLTAETQRIIVPMLKHTESLPRTEAIRITMMPRAGTLALPQLYQSEIILQSQPPWYKNLVYKWKWTFSVWTSMYLYVTMLLILLNWCRPLIFPGIATSFMTTADVDLTVEAPEEPQEKAREESDVSESVRRWSQTRRKRKVMLQRSVSRELADDSASSISITREDTADSSG